MRPEIPIRAALTYIPNALAYLKFRHWFAGIRRENPALFALIDDILRRFHDSGGLRWSGQDFKLYHLWRLCISRKPQSILEFGFGSSTAILAHFCREFGSNLVTIDESVESLGNTRSLCEITAAHRITFISSERKEDLQQEPPSCQYAWKSDCEYDFVVVDGPSINPDPRFRRKQICADALALRYPQQATIAVDGRFATYRHISHALGVSWVAQPSSFRMFAKTLFSNSYRSYSILYR